jgi:hypothetical protein
VLDELQTMIEVSFKATTAPLNASKNISAMKHSLKEIQFFAGSLERAESYQKIDLHLKSFSFYRIF